MAKGNGKNELTAGEQALVDDGWDVEIKNRDTADLADPGDAIEGRYLGYRVIHTRYGDRRMHVFAQDDGTIVEMWGSADRDRKLAISTLGRMTRVERTDTETDRMVIFRVLQRGQTNREGVIGRPAIMQAEAEIR